MAFIVNVDISFDSAEHGLDLLPAPFRIAHLAPHDIILVLEHGNVL